MESTILPPWMVYAGSIAGLVWAVLQIISWLNNILHMPKLEIRLTKEIFFRLIEDGETIFTNAVLMARNSPIEITNVTFTLNRVSGSKKEFVFSPTNIGNKVANPPSPYAANNFWTKSCKMFIAENVPTHILFLSALEEYSINFKNSLDEFNQKVSNYQAELQSILKEIQENENEYVQKINDRLNSIVSETKSNLLPIVQLEPGDYELLAEIDYSKIRVKFFGKMGKAKSKISFTVTKNFEDLYKLQLNRFLEIQARNILFNQTNNFNYPEYQPENIKEI